MQCLLILSREWEEPRRFWLEKQCGGNCALGMSVWEERERTRVGRVLEGMLRRRILHRSKGKLMNAHPRVIGMSVQGKK